MMSKDLTQAEAEQAFWEALEKSNTGLLGLDKPGYHHQPMTAFRDGETGGIWFFTRNDTDLARDVAGGEQPSMFCYSSKDQKLWACIHGDLTNHGADPAVIDQFWNPVLAAWYPEGKEDPHLTILRFEAGHGRIWVSDGGLAKFAYEIAKANITKTTPDTGGVQDVNLG